MPRTGRWIVGALSVTLLAASGRTLFVSSAPSAESFHIGYFEGTGDEPRLVSSDERPSSFPAPGISDDPRVLEQPPGLSLLLPLAGALRYRFSVPSPGRAPYVVLGRRADDLALWRLTSALVTTAEDARLGLQEWSPAAPWREDRRRLEELARACGTAGKPVSLSVERFDETIELRLGDCEPMRLAADTAEIVASVAGPDWVEIERGPEPWPLQHSIRPWLLLSVATLASLAGFALGPWGAWRTLATALVVGGLSLVLPGGALAALLLLALGGLLRLATRLLRGLSLRRGLLLALLALASGLAFALVFPRPPPLPFDTGDARAALLGYSTVAGFGLRQGHPGVLPLLLEHCPSCEGHLSVRGFPGKDITHLLEALRRSPGFLRERRTVVLLAGTNDDLSIRLGDLSGETTWMALRMVLGALSGEVSTREIYSLMLDQAPVRVHEQGAARHEALRSLVREARSHGASFWLIHDFLAQDMGADAGPVRERLRDERRQAVTEEGGHFVDLLHMTLREEGVSWFTDVIHLSQIGMMQVGRLVNRAISEDAPGTDGVK